MGRSGAPSRCQMRPRAHPARSVRTTDPGPARLGGRSTPCRHAVRLRVLHWRPEQWTRSCQSRREGTTERSRPGGVGQSRVGPAADTPPTGPFGGWAAAHRRPGREVLPGCSFGPRALPPGHGGRPPPHLAPRRAHLPATNTQKPQGARFRPQAQPTSHRCRSAADQDGAVDAPAPTSCSRTTPEREYHGLASPSHPHGRRTDSRAPLNWVGMGHVSRETRVDRPHRQLLGTTQPVPRRGAGHDQATASSQACPRPARPLLRPLRLGNPSIQARRESGGGMARRRPARRSSGDRPPRRGTPCRGQADDRLRLGERTLGPTRRPGPHPAPPGGWTATGVPPGTDTPVPPRASPPRHRSAPRSV